MRAGSGSGAARFDSLPWRVTVAEIVSIPDLEERLRSEAALRQAIEASMAAGIAVVDHDGTQTHVNPSMCRMVGWSRDELIGARPPFPYWPSDEVASIEAAFEKTLAGKAPAEGFELRFQRKNGERFDALVLISELKEPCGRSRGWLASVYDVTERKRAVRRLHVLAEASAALSEPLDYESALSKLAEFAVSTIADYCVTYSFDGTRRIRRVGLAHRNPAHRRLVEDLVRAGPPSIDDPYGAGRVILTGAPILAPEIPAALLETAAQNAEHLRVLQQLQPRSSIVVPLIARGRTLGAFAITHTDDSGERYGRDDLILAEELARRAALLIDNARLYREAQVAIAKRDELVAFVSHDLKNPIQVQLAACTLLRHEKSGREQYETALEAIECSAVQMQRLIVGLLDVARIEGERLLSVNPVEPVALLVEATRAIAPLARQKAIELGLELAGDLPPVMGDHERLLQVLSNLLGNAVKFSPPGGEVGVRAERTPDGVRISVTDAGPGIAPEEQSRVFDRFWQSDRSREEGTGLGLAIAKSIVEAHGGTIGIESEVGAGATFWFTLPERRVELS
jgi:PAS domain S-box-containing protein